MPLTGWQANEAWELATDVQKFGCTIPEDDCKLCYNRRLSDGRLWIGLVAFRLSAVGLG